MSSAFISKNTLIYKDNQQSFKQLLEQKKQELKEELSQLKITGLQAVNALSLFFDSTIQQIADKNEMTHLNSLAIIAVGGYGRNTVAPFSDLDLLFVIKNEKDQTILDKINALLYVLWDMKVKTGHSIRTIKSCYEDAKKDMTLRTNFLDMRYITGSHSLFQHLEKKLKNELFAETAIEFIEAKLKERNLRHAKAGGSRYVVEPNVKDGKGGLRDLHTLFWIAKYVYGIHDRKELVEKGIFSKDDYRILIRSENFLWTVRVHLHFAYEKAQEKISFDIQSTLADQLGYQKRFHTKAVERFMKHYFLTAKTVGDLTRIFCAVLEEKHCRRTQPFYKTLFSLLSVTALGGQLAIHGDRLDFAYDNALQDDPFLIVRIFWEADQHNIDIHPNALKIIRKNLRLISNEFRNHQEPYMYFRKILCNAREPEIALRRMNEAGVLGLLVPDFGKIVALMQFNRYHHYTADEHLIYTIGILHQIEQQKLTEECPLSSVLIQQINMKDVLYLVVFLHDIAKGRKEDHSIAGARIATELAPKMGFTPAETKLVEWLVLHHLHMSDVAQRRDISDPKTIVDFGNFVQTQERLKMLLILTVADIRGVGPGVWNGWKGDLLRRLYAETTEFIQGKFGTQARSSKVEYIKSNFAKSLNDNAIMPYFEAMPNNYWLSIDEKTLQDHINLVKQSILTKSSFGFYATPDPFRSTTKIMLFMQDAIGTFNKICGAISYSRMDIADAKIFTSMNNTIIDTLWVQDIDKKSIKDPQHLERLRFNIELALQDKLEISKKLGSLEKPSDVFEVDPMIFIDNNGSETCTIIEVEAKDRVGLLYDITTALRQLKLSLSSAHIATYGEKAADVFYVKNIAGLKITQESAIQKIKDTILNVL